MPDVLSEKALLAMPERNYMNAAQLAFFATCCCVLPGNVSRSWRLPDRRCRRHPNRTRWMPPWTKRHADTSCVFLAAARLCWKKSAWHCVDSIMAIMATARSAESPSDYAGYWPGPPRNIAPR